MEPIKSIKSIESIKSNKVNKIDKIEINLIKSIRKLCSWNSFLDAIFLFSSIYIEGTKTKFLIFPFQLSVKFTSV